MISFKGVKGLSQFNKKIIAYIQKASLQQKNKWDFLLFRNPLTPNVSSNGILGAVQGVAGVAVDALISKTFVQSIQFHAGVKFTTERAGGDFYVKDIEYPESVSITFIDVEEGYVMRYLQDWMNDVAEPADLMDSKQGYIFRDSQEYAKRTGILLLNTSQEKSLKYPRIMFYGLVPRSLGDITVEQGEGGHLLYTVDFAVREVRIPRLL